MLTALLRNARAASVPSVVFTFDPPPTTILRPDEAPPAITTTERKVELLTRFGVDGVIVYPTDRALLEMTPREFFDRIIKKELGATALVEGPNFCFGKQRAGTIDVLREFCEQDSIHLEIIPPVTIGDQLVSSTEIRRLILAGRVADAAKLLGSPYQLEGTITRGAGRGRGIGFPTANLIEIETVVPADGVYAGRVYAGSTWYAAGINIGPNPTFGEQQRKVEVHAIDFHGELHDRELAVEFLDRLRDTVPFASVDELKLQLQRDIDLARNLAKGTPVL